MASQVIRARVALIALFVAIVFVVVGFTQADREITRAEQDRAIGAVGEAATLIENFLLRQLAELRLVEQVVGNHRSGTPWASDSVVRKLLPQSGRYFNQLWLVDSGQIRNLIDYSRDESISLDTIRLAQVLRNHSSSNPTVVALRNQDNSILLFIESVQNSPQSALIGVARAEFLSEVLQRQQRSRTQVGFLVRASNDTVVRLATAATHGLRSVERPIITPLTSNWVVVMSYAPSGRAAQLALWVVGLGAILGLGIGLLLERREAARIADRSSELEHLSMELLRANRAKSEFLANVSHELRTPLNAIVGFVDLLRDGVYGPLNSRQTGPVERIEASANHLRHLVDQVLDLAKIAAGRLEVHSEPIELRPFVFDVASEVEPLMTEKGLSFSLAVGASLPRVRTDPTHLRQILINLLGNAVKFTTHGGISVRGKLVRRTETTAGITSHDAATRLLVLPHGATTPWIALQVADSGIGIPERDRDRIFDEFEQVNAGPRGDSMRRGTGLGLSISRRLARLLGGDITVETELGRGSVFTLWLPIDSADLSEDQGA